MKIKVSIEIDTDGWDVNYDNKVEVDKMLNSVEKDLEESLINVGINNFNIKVE
jgi:hypothetical protein